jgi:ribosomal protein S18 acetylase RimI-like enzyme
MSSDGEASIVIRPALPADLPWLAELYEREIETQQALSGAFALISQVDWTGYVAAKQEHRDFEILVAANNNGLAGFIELRIVDRSGKGLWGRLRALARRILRPQSWPASRYGFIEEVYVKPELRRNGLATLLVEQAFQWFRSRGLTRVLAAIWASNWASLQLAEALDFHPTRVLMSKRIQG